MAEIFANAQHNAVAMRAGLELLDHGIGHRRLLLLNSAMMRLAMRYAPRQIVGGEVLGQGHQPASMVAAFGALPRNKVTRLFQGLAEIFRRAHQVVQRGRAAQGFPPGWHRPMTVSVCGRRLPTARFSMMVISIRTFSSQPSQFGELARRSAARADAPMLHGALARHLKDAKAGRKSPDADHHHGKRAVGRPPPAN